METQKPVHSKIGASSMHRWGNCPGSVRLCADIPPKTSSYAEEGTLAHSLAAMILEGKDSGPMSDEMAEAVLTFVNYVREIQLANPGCTLLIEHSFDLSKIHPGLYGTADVVIFIPEKQLLIVIDFKYGAGIFVDVFQNEQLSYYGLGALLSTNFKAKEVELVIVQPRCDVGDPIRSWRFNSLELLDFAADLKAAAVRTEDPFAPLAPGDWCRFCPAIAVCPALHERGQMVAKEEFSSVKPYDTNRLGQILEWLPSLESWIKGVREFAYGEAQHGRCPPGWKLVAKRATRKWRDENSAIDLAKKLNPKELIETVTSLKSPAQVEKIMGKKMYELNFSHHVVAESSGVTLAPESDKREAVKVDAKTEFENANNFDNLLN